MLVVAGPGGSGKTSTLHACLRQLGPDLDHVVLMGRLRSPESVTMAAQAALRGHLVLTAMATSDGAMTLGRLVDMGLSPELVTSSVLAVLSQRLVRRLCSECRVPYSPSGHEQAELGLDSTATIFHARDGGCAACRGLGYRGRVGIFELLCMNDELRRRTMREDGALKVIAGIASVEEVVTMTTRGE
jgi:type II secretory ATPase GspE/PulE/Tfp pilus assembly ATPase PilB-like protein